MTVQDYLRVFRERWLVLVLAALLGLAAGAGAFLLRPPAYTAQISMYVSAQVGADPQQAYLGAQLSAQRVKSYTGLITSPRVMKETVAELGLPESPQQLAGDVTASSSVDSIVIDVAATQPTADRAARVADAVGERFTALVDELERPASPEDAAPVAIRIVQPADVPSSPSSTGLPLTLAVGLFAGLVLGAAFVLARNALDVSLRSPADLEAVSGAPTLGVTAHDPDVPRHPLTVRDDPLGPHAEAFRQLRTNLQFVDVDTPRTVLMVTSAMPAEGKSTTVANLAIAFAAAGSRVLLVEADLRRPALVDLFGLEQSVGLTGVLAGRLRLGQAVQPWDGGTLHVLTGGAVPPNPSELLGSRQMRTVLDEARATYDVVLVDCPPLLPVTDAAALAPATDGAVVVCRYRSTSRTQLASAVAALRAVSSEPLGTVFTMVPVTGPRAYAQYAGHYRAARVPDGTAAAVEPVRASPPTLVAAGRTGPPSHPSFPAAPPAVGPAAGARNGVPAGRPAPARRPAPPAAPSGPSSAAPPGSSPGSASGPFSGPQPGAPNAHHDGVPPPAAPGAPGPDAARPPAPPRDGGTGEPQADPPPTGP